MRRITIAVALLLLVVLAAWVVGFPSRSGRIGASPGETLTSDGAGVSGPMPAARAPTSTPSPSGLRVSFETKNFSP